MKEEKNKIADLRKDYVKGFDAMTTMSENPYDVFEQLFNLALENQIPEPNAMTLATATKEGIPSARMVLLKGYDEDGFNFYTNFNSQKGREMAENPNVALVFNWLGMETQIRIEGSISMLSDEVSTNYFQSRPRKSQIGAWASDQSSIIENSELLKTNFEMYDEKFKEEELIPKPPHWGGYKVAPRRIEFWFGRRSRLHFRRSYVVGENGKWEIFTLSP